MTQVTYTTQSFALPAWAAEELRPDRLMPGGARLDPSAFSIEPLYTINVASAGAALGATTLPVDALPIALQSGTVLDFGVLDAMTVTATATPADNATTLAVSALSRAIPAGTYLDFGSSKFAVVTTAAAIGATSLTTLAMPSGTKPANTNTATLAAGRKIATLTANASAAATSLTVAALNFQAVDADKATYGVGTKRPVDSGTLVGRTFTERGNGVGFGSPDVSTPDDELYLTAFEVIDASINPDVTLLRHDTLIYEDKLPGWSGLSSQAKTAIRARYRCITYAAI